MLIAERLHLGCFDLPVAGWTNTDVTPHLFVARVPGAASCLYRLGKLNEQRIRQHRSGVFRNLHYLNVGKRFPLKSDSVSAIFSSHMLEHLPPQVAENCLSECFRILKPGGVIRSCVPDLDYYVEQYRQNDPEPFVDALFQTLENSGKNRHYWMYNESSLIRALLALGFSRASRKEFQQGDCPNLADLDNRPQGTLFVEAIK